MWERIQDTFASVDWNGLFENVSNDRLVALFTHPYGMVGLGVLLVLTVVLKWRVMFVAIAGALLVALLTRYTLVSDQVGPDKTVLLFAGGGVAVGAFVIYYLFIRED
jgi:hypothetical protein